MKTALASAPEGELLLDSLEKNSTTGGLALADYFEMQNQQQENDSDADLGSGGALVPRPHG